MQLSEAINGMAPFNINSYPFMAVAVGLKFILTRK